MGLPHLLSITEKSPSSPPRARHVGVQRGRPLRLLAVILLAATPALGGLVPACTTGAVGVEACRSIEAARCEALRACPVALGGYTTDAQVNACTLFYRDECLHGVESKAAPSDNEANACVAAVRATAACAKAGADSLDGCAGAELETGDPKAISPCAVILSAVDQLKACSFVDAADAGAADADAGKDSGDAAAD